MKKYLLKKNVLLILGVVLGIVLAVSLRQARRQQHPGSGISMEPIVNKADVEVKKMELSETESGDLTWNLKAEKAQMYEKEGIAYLQNIVLEYLLGDGEQVVLSGDRGKINLVQKNVFLEGNVGASSYQVQLKTKTLSWDREKRILLTEDPVWLRRENIRMSGRGMVADMDLRKIRLNKEIRTEIY